MSALPISVIMLVDIFGALFAIVCLLFVRIPDPVQSGEKTHVLSDLKQGFAAMRSNKPFMAAFWPIVLMNILYMPLASLFPLLVRTHFQGNAWHNGIAEFAFAGGLLLSSIALGIWGGMKRRFLMMSLAIGLLGLSTLISVPFLAYTQESIAPELLGKVFSLCFTAMSLAMPVGLLIAGPVSEAAGIDKWFFWSGVALILNGLFCRLLTKPHDRISG